MKKLFLLFITGFVMAMVLLPSLTSAEESMEAVYARFVKSLMADDIEGAKACMNKYNRDQWRDKDKDQIAVIIKGWKENTFSPYSVVSSKISGKRAFLNTKARGKIGKAGPERDLEGKIGFVNEDGAWKIYTLSYR